MPASVLLRRLPEGKNSFMSEQIISVDRMEQAVSLFGNFDENIRLIEEHYRVDVVSRGSDLKVEGDPENVARAVRAIHGLLQLINRGEQLNEQNIRYVLMLVDEGTEEQLPQLSADSICITAKGKPIKAKTLGQKKYVEAIRTTRLCWASAPPAPAKPILPWRWRSTLSVPRRSTVSSSPVLRSRPVKSSAFCPATCSQR